MKKVDVLDAAKVVVDEKIEANYDKVKQLRDSGDVGPEFRALAAEGHELIELSYCLQEMCDLLYERARYNEMHND